MSQEWIEKLAEDLKTKGREAAERYGREQHRAGIVTEQGRTFFAALVLSLEDDFTAIRSRLQGSAISCDTAIQRVNAVEVHLTRSRFPWFEATLKHAAEDIVLDFAQGRGVMGEPGNSSALSTFSGGDRQSVHFSFQVDAQDKLLVAESFEETQRQFDRPEQLARHIVELLFKA